MKRQNNGIIEYQKNKRNDTMSRIDEAYEYLSTTHQPISKSSLSRESGISRVTLNKPEITEYLKKYPEFCPNNESISILEANQTLKEENQKLRSALSQARNRNNRIAKENLQLRKDYDELKVKYAKVLGMNQKLQEKRLIKL